MTVVKEDEVSESCDQEQLEPMTDSTLPDDWSIIEGSVSTQGVIDNENISDGESVEVIPCDEEKAEDHIEGMSPCLVVAETQEKVVQTEECPYDNVKIWLPRLIAIAVASHLIIFLFSLAAQTFTGNSDEYKKREFFSDLKIGNLPDSVNPAFAEILEDWGESSPRTAEERALILNFITRYFPLESHGKEIVALLKKDLIDGKEAPTPSVHTHQPHQPHQPPPKVLPKTAPPPPERKAPPNTAYAYQARSRPSPPPQRNTDPKRNGMNRENSENRAFDCSDCKKGSNCKKFCKHPKTKKWLRSFQKLSSMIQKAKSKIMSFKNIF